MYEKSIGSKMNDLHLRL